MTPTPRRTIQPNGFLEGHGLSRSMRATQASRRLAKLESPAPAPAYVAVVADVGSLGYHIAFPDIPRCWTDADSVSDIIPRARKALAEHFATNPGRKARTISEIKDDGRYRRALDRGDNA